MVSKELKELKHERDKKSIAAEVIYSEKANEIFNHIQKVKEKMINLTNFGSRNAATKRKEINSSELLELINRINDELDYLGEELMRKDIRIATATGLIELHPYPTDCEAERKRLAEVNKEIENRVNSKNFPH